MTAAATAAVTVAAAGSSTNNMGSTRDLEDFRTLSSTKQNVELFKILTAISVEIRALQESTERRFSALEGAVKKQLKNGGNGGNKSKEEESERGSSAGGGGGGAVKTRGGQQWETLRLNRSYNHYKNMAG